MLITSIWELRMFARSTEKYSGLKESVKYLSVTLILILLLKDFFEPNSRDMARSYPSNLSIASITIMASVLHPSIRLI
jgi:hypothetical protein